MHLTTGYELTTALTNAVIFVVCVCGFITIKKEKLWKLFFFFMSIDSFLGVIVHGVAMSIQVNVILWIILSIFFTLTVNTFFVIFLKFKVRHIIILSILLTLFMMVQIYFDMDFIFSFTMYIMLIMIISIYYIIKDNLKNKKYFLIGFLVALIGGLLMLTHVKFWILDHNGICHMFLAVTMILFIIGLKKRIA